jgi:hypothetical protein
LAALIFFLRAPVYGDFFCDTDSADAAYAAQLAREGRCPYDEAILSKPPGSVILYALTFQLFGARMTPIHLLAALWAWATALLLYQWARRLDHEWTGIAAATLYAFYQADLLAAGPCANFEFWTILPAVGCLFLATVPPLTRTRLFVAGLLAVVAVSMKQPAILFGLAALVLVWLGAFVREDERGARAALRQTGWFVGGAASGALLFAFLLGQFDCLAAMWRELNPFRLSRYLAAYDRGDRLAFFVYQMKRFAASSPWLLTLGAGGVAIAGWAWRIPRRRPLILAALVSLLAAIGAWLAGGHFFGHYFVLLIPFLSLSGGLLLGPELTRRTGMRLMATLGIVLAFVLHDGRPELTSAWTATRALAQTGSPLSADLFDANRRRAAEPGHWNEMLGRLEWQPALRQVSDFLRGQLRPGDTIWGYDYLGELYFWTGVFAPTRHHEHFELVTAASQPHYGLWHREETDAVRRNRAEAMADLARRPPAFIAFFAHECRSPSPPDSAAPDNWPFNVYGRPMATCPAKVEVFPALAEFVAARYERVVPPVNNAVELYRLVR